MESERIEPTALDRLMVLAMIVLIMATIMAATTGETLAQLRWCPKC